MLLIGLVVANLLSCGSSDSDTISSNGSGLSTEFDKNWLEDDYKAIENGDHNYVGYDLVLDSIAVVDENFESSSYDEMTKTSIEYTLNSIKQTNEPNTYYFVDENYDKIDSIVNYAGSSSSFGSTGINSFEIYCYDFSTETIYIQYRRYEYPEDIDLESTTKMFFESQKEMYLERKNN